MGDRETIADRIAFIGAGVLGTALAMKLQETGYRLTAAASLNYLEAKRLASLVTGCKAFRDNQSAADVADIVFITTPDDVIAETVSELKWRAGQSVVHCSGAVSLGALDPARQAGASVGSFHPIQSFSTVEQAKESLMGSVFAIEAEGNLSTTLKEIVKAFQGSWILLKSEDRAIYHTSATVVSNYLVTLVNMAADLWETIGLSREEAIKALIPLIRGTVNNIENIGLPDCLTGPIARGDMGTIRKHLNALDEKAPEIATIYREIGYNTVPIALAKGKIDERKAAELRKLLKPQTGDR